MKEKERGALDFDQPGGVDTTWQRIYCCLRAGFHAEAAQVAKSARELATPRAGASDLAQQVAQWGEGGCRPLGGDAGAHLSAECERLLRDKSARQRHPFSAQRAMVHALLSGNNRAAEAVVKVGGRWLACLLACWRAGWLGAMLGLGSFALAAQIALLCSVWPCSNCLLAGLPSGGSPPV